MLLLAKGARLILMESAKLNHTTSKCDAEHPQLNARSCCSNIDKSIESSHQNVASRRCLRAQDYLLACLLPPTIQLSIVLI